MQVATVRNQPSGDRSLSLNMMLHDEPVALYVTALGALSLQLRGGAMMVLQSSQDCSMLAQQEEVTIESFVGGFLAAGYRISIRNAA